MKKYIIGNWKMYPETIDEVYNLCKLLADVEFNHQELEIVICPPAPFLFAAKEILSETNIVIGSQNHFNLDSGAFTGEYSAKMLASLGARFAIVGHSERRASGETSQAIKDKIVSALENGLTPVYCIGDNENSIEDAISFLKEQIKNELGDIDSANYHKILFAYEPIWAIGKNAVRTANPKDVQVILNALLEFLKEKNATPLGILYGGSVDAENAKLFIKDGSADGVLIGRASLDPEKFKKIINSINEI